MPWRRNARRPAQARLALPACRGIGSGRARIGGRGRRGRPGAHPRRDSRRGAAKKVGKPVARVIGLSIAETIVRLFDELLVVSRVDEGMLPDAVPRLCGCSEELVYRLKAVSPHQSNDEEETNEQEENWLKGFED